MPSKHDVTGSNPVGRATFCGFSSYLVVLGKVWRTIRLKADAWTSIGSPRWALAKGQLDRIRGRVHPRPAIVLLPAGQLIPETFERYPGNVYP